MTKNELFNIKDNKSKDELYKKLKNVGVQNHLRMLYIDTIDSYDKFTIAILMNPDYTINDYLKFVESEEIIFINWNVVKQRISKYKNIIFNYNL